MTKEEYERYADELLKSLGGGWDTPSGYNESGMWFSCAPKTLFILYPDRLSESARKTVVDELSKKYGFPYIPS